MNNVNFDKLLSHAKDNNISDLSIRISYSNGLSIDILNDEIDKYEGSSNLSYTFKGKYNKKFGVYITNSYNEDDNDTIISSIINGANFKDDSVEELLHDDNNKINVPLIPQNIDFRKKINSINSFHKQLKEYDNRIKNARIVSEYNESSIRIVNSKGLDKTDSTNGYINYLSVVCNDKDLVKSDDFRFDGINDFDFSKILFETADRALKMLKPKLLSTGRYSIILAKDPSADIFDYLLDFFYADSVQKDKSIFKNMLEKNIATDKLTIIEDPTDDKMLYKRLFDDDGVNTYRKELITDGVLNMYLYNLKAAVKDGVSSTGNGYANSTAVTNMYIKPSKTSFDELLKQIDNGIYVTRVGALHSGIDNTSGSISLKSNGYLIENGEIKDYLEDFILNTDFKTMINKIEEIGSDLDETSRTFRSPSLFIKDIDITF